MPAETRRRWRMLNPLAAGLAIHRDMGIVGDVDEILVADPAGWTLPELLRRAVRPSRGGHYADFPRLAMPAGLYLLHLKQADRDLYAATQDRRNAAAREAGVDRPAEAMIGRHWFEAGRDDAATFAATDALPVSDDWGFAAEREAMARSWGARGETGYYQFTLPVPAMLHRLPPRFATLL